MDVPAIRCAACGAPIQPDASQCPYCRSVVATVACPNCMAMVSLEARHCHRCGAAVDIQPDEGSGCPCPECNLPLARTAVGGNTLDQCRRCGGVWLGKELFDRLAADHERRGQILGALPGGQGKGAVTAEAVRYRPCPSCGELMHRSNFGRISGVVLDTCKTHGLWFDRDELRRVLEFIATGGLDKARERQIQELEDKRRLAAASQPLPTAEWNDASAWNRTSEWKGTGLLDVVEAVFWLARRGL